MYARNLLPWLGAAALAALGAPAARGQAAPPAPRPRAYQPLRYEEDYRYLHHPDSATEALDTLKYLPMRARPDWFVTLGGEARLRYERFDHPQWGQAPSDGYGQQRYLPLADVHLGPHVRVFGQLVSALENRQRGAAPPTAENRLDVGQLFGDVVFNLKPNDLTTKHTLTLRAGRQEMVFGTAQLVGTREPLNVRRAFDGVRVSGQGPVWRVDAFLTRPVQPTPGLFDDGPDRAQAFWGAYAVRPWRRLPAGHVDLYYFGLRRAGAVFQQDTARELRHTLGTRLWGKAPRWEYSADLLVQWGRFGTKTIRAGAVFSEINFALAGGRLQPRLGLRAEAGSGAQSREGGSLHTFNALFPKGAYYLEPVLVGPSNRLVLSPLAELRHTDRLRILADAAFFWRASRTDGVYGNAANPLRPGPPSRARFVGAQPELTVRWQASRHFALVGLVARFFTGPFLRETGPGQDVTYVSTWLTFTY